MIIQLSLSLSSIAYLIITLIHYLFDNNVIQAVTVLRKLAKMRQESIQMFQDGGALDRANAEREELQVIERWLPQLANEEQTTTWVLEAIETVGSVDNVGKIMGALMKLHKNELDGTLTQRIVKEQVAKVKQQQ
jgi:uncharacterized protein YqeY